MSLKILYFGMLGEFSRLPLEKLLAAGVVVCGVVVPGEKRNGRSAINLLPPQKPVTSLPLLTPYRALNIVHLAWEHGIPAYELSQPDAEETLVTLAQLQPDAALMVCFSRRIPARLLALPRHGFLNLHPSRLPACRGPEPLFWQLRDGVDPVGVTLHVMEEEWDTGDIVGQTAVSLPDGISRNQIDTMCAAVGAELMLAALAQLADGSLHRSPQPQGGSYQSLPQLADFELDVNWSAQRAFNFMRGTAEYTRPYPLQVANQTIKLTEALAYEPDGVLGEAMVVEGNGREVLIQFTPGILHIRMFTG